MSDDDFEDIPDEDMLEVLEGLSASVPAPAPAPAPTPPRPDRPPDPYCPGGPPPGLSDLPSDAFNSTPEPEPEPEPTRRTVSEAVHPHPPQPRQDGLVRTASGTTTRYRQTTLWGTSTTAEERPRALQRCTSRTFSADAAAEQPTHHALDHDALRTWVYPTNLGAIRDYQFTIVKASLYSNTLVALPTGLGKTFIAATVMLNYYRWARDGQIVFVAPTKPLATQQVDACFNIVGIPRSHTTLLTGEVAPALRADEWKCRRVFFMTPQTLLNDLSIGYADPKKMVLLVVDEAHRATGEYAYAKVVRYLRRFSSSFRVLALTATPGSSVEAVQEVIDNLGIAHVEIRTEESLDIRQYVHSRDIEKHVLAYSDEILLVRHLLTSALRPMVDKLGQQNIYYARDPMNFTAYGLMQAQREWFAAQARGGGHQGQNQGLLQMIRAIFALLTGVAHSIKLLNLHGIKPFFDSMAEFRRGVEAAGDKGSKYKRQLVQDDSFTEMMDQIQTWLRSSSFVGHPKLHRLTETVLNHFMDAGQQQQQRQQSDSTTRIIVFSEYRDSAEEIVRVLNQHQPLVKAAVFVGQADTKRSGGMKQARQMETIDRFKRGDFNVLVATSVGEEGLDIGQVDLIVCYDASSSPIRMLQRMGRTGRKRAGRIVLLLMQGREEDNYARSRDGYEAMQKLICEGSRFNFRADLSTRIVPRDVRPEVDKRAIDIPVENTQDRSMPEPRRRGGGGGAGAGAGTGSTKKGKKKPAKKFHMPDGVEVGFITASALAGMSGGRDKKEKEKETEKEKEKKERGTEKERTETDDLAEVLPLERVCLDRHDEQLLNRKFRSLLPRSSWAGRMPSTPWLGMTTRAERCLGAVAGVKHGQHTIRMVELYQTLARLHAEKSAEAPPPPYDRPARDTYYLDIPVRDFAPDTDDDGDGDDDDVVEQGRLSSAGRKRLSAADPDDAMEEGSRPKRRKATSNAGATPKGDMLRLLPPGPIVDLEDLEGPGALEGPGELPPIIRRSAAPKKKAPSHKTRAPAVVAAAATAAGDRGRGRGRGRGRSRGRGQGRGRALINSDEPGDDCMRDSDLFETDGSDDGADLVDFIVSDNHPISSMVDDEDDDDDDDDDSNINNSNNNNNTSSSSNRNINSNSNSNSNYNDFASSPPTTTTSKRPPRLLPRPPPPARSARRRGSKNGSRMAGTGDDDDSEFPDISRIGRQVDDEEKASSSPAVVVSTAAQLPRRARPRMLISDDDDDDDNDDG